MPLRIISHYPDINAIEVPRNIHIKIEFNSGIIPGSLDYTHVSVHDAASFASVPGTLGIEYTPSGISSIVAFEPLLNLTANTKYKVYVFGKPNSVISTGNEQLASTYIWEFTTGITILEGQMPEGVPSGDLPSSGTIIEETSISSGTYLQVVSTNPSNQTPNISGLEYIKINFNYRPNLSGINIYDYITVTSQDVL